MSTIPFVNPEFAEACAEFVVGMREDRDSEHGGLLDALQRLRGPFTPDASAILWAASANDWRVKLSLPKDSATIEQWLANDALREQLADLYVSGAAHLMFPSDPPRQDGHLHYEGEFMAIRIPPVFDGMRESARCYVALVSPDLRTPTAQAPYPRELSYLASLLDAWGSRIVRLRQLQDSACASLIYMRPHRDVSPGPDDREGVWDAVCSCTAGLRGLMTMREVLHVARAAVAHRPNSFEVVPELLASTLGADLQKWHCCAPPDWPTCDGLESPECARIRKRARLLIGWCLWRDIDSGVLGRLRRCADGPDEPDEWPGGDWTAAVAQFGDLRAHVKGLRRESFAAVEPEKLHRKSLFSYALGHMLRKPESREAFWDSTTRSDEEFARGLSYIATSAHHLLGDLRLDGETIQSMIWMLSEYAHRSLGIPARIDLRAHLLLGSREEPALHALKEHYRDHFFHAQEVCFLGHFLLDMDMGDGQPFWKRVAARMSGGASRTRVLRLWYLAALLHDVGYGVDLLQGVQDLLKFFKNAKALQGLGDDLSRACDNVSKRIGKKGFVDYEAEDKVVQDHGVVAALHLQELLKGIAKDDPSVVVKEYEPAIRAIALHNSRKHTVAFKKDPLAFLLIVCDTIQEWNRLQLSFATAPASILARLRERGVREEELTGPLDSVAVNAKRRKPGDVRRFALDGTPRTLRFTLTYSEEVNRNANVFHLWLDASRNFQRLDFKGLPKKFDIQVEYVTPLYRKREPGASEEQQMHRLRDAADRTHMGFLDEWFPNVKQGEVMTNGAVEHGVKEASGNGRRMEHLSLNLRALSKKKRITKDIGEFHKSLRRWHRYSEDRDFAGDYGAPESPS